MSRFIGSEELRARNRLAVAKSREKHKEKRAAYVAKHYAENRDRLLEAHAKWKAKNPGYASTWGKANKSRVAAYARRTRAKNPERYAQVARDARLRRLDHLRELARLWRIGNRQKCRMYCRRREAATLRAVPIWADHELIELVYAESVHRGMTVDHIVPLRGANVCGLHVHYNMQLLSKSQNSAKYNRIMFLVQPRLGE